MRGLVIKPGDSPSLARGAIGLDLRDVARQADAILAAARAEAQRIATQARVAIAADRERSRQTAHEEGFARGRGEGFEAGRQAAVDEARAAFAADHGALSDALLKLLQDFGERREALYAAARRDVVVLAVVIASRVCGKLADRADAAPEMALQAADEALKLLRGATQPIIRVHPADAAALDQLAERLSAAGLGRSASAESSHVRIVEDSSVPRGGVLLTTADPSAGAECRIDASITTRIERIADELVSHWRERAAELSLEP